MVFCRPVRRLRQRLFEKERLRWQNDAPTPKAVAPVSPLVYLLAQRQTRCLSFLQAAGYLRWQVFPLPSKSDSVRQPRLTSAQRQHVAHSPLRSRAGQLQFNDRH